jgi:tetratricopeptide (TPR) repeat protein
MRHAAPLRLRPIAGLLFAALAATSSIASAYDAEIVSLVGRGDARSSTRDDWKAAAVRQQLNAGAFIRTADGSQMAVLLRDNTQLRLNQNSMLQIKEVSPSGEPTKLELTQGRVWTQAKRKEYTAPPPGSVPAVTVQTPNAIAAIRGTDWELAVDKDGSALLTVLSGEVEFYNDFGRVSVKPNEQAHVEKGKAPVKTLLTNARDRVQWVTAYRPQPHRWLAGFAIPQALLGVVAAIDSERYGEAFTLIDKTKPTADSAAAVALVKADLLLFQGEAAAAIKLLETPQPASPLSPRLAALLARAYLIADKPEEAKRVLKANTSDDAEVALARGDLARFEGDAGAARAAFDAALGKEAKNADAWFGIGRIAAEREAVKDGRSALNQAIAIDPKGAGYRGELATLETFANEFTAADAAFKVALEQQPDDYSALTGLGILQLKKGEPDAALESFLKAGVIEPRYARAALYTGVAYYQLGNHQRAIEMFNRAAALDAKDPLPHMMLSLVAADRMEMGSAVASAREASRLMPFLKSLNQLLNNQKGNANVGASLAQFGLEEWANAYAYNSYSPYWAGSALFLADRYSGDFTKNSELFKGFLADPTVFGASNRFNSLVASPGNYATAGGRAINSDTQERGVSLSANGYNVASFPLAYFASVDPTHIRPSQDDLRVNADNYTVGLGARPTYELGLFLFANNFNADAKLGNIALGSEKTDASIDTQRVDAGINYKLSPTSQLWLKAGSGQDKRKAGGAIATASEIADSYGLFLGGLPATGKITRYQVNTDQKDIQFRHSFDASSAWQVSWGYEHGKQDKTNDQANSYGDLTLATQGSDNRRSNEAYLSNRFRPSDNLLLQGDLSHMNFTKRQNGTPQALVGFSVFTHSNFNDSRDISEWNPRLGLAWQPSDGQTLRFAAQKWRRPASVASLGQVDTAGITVDDRLVSIGGELKRARLQYEWEASNSTFIQAYVDSKRVTNIASTANTLVTDINLQDLERLRNRNRLSAQALDFLEQTPEFGEAKVNTFGVAVNRVLADNLSGAARYQHNQSRNTGAGFEGNTVPWLAKNVANVGLTWLPVARWQLGAQATYRSSRYQDEANTQLLKAGWNLGLRSYWESVDKRLSVEAIVENLHADKQAAVAHSPTVGVQMLYRF